MSRIVLDCKGRLANQILCWANARHVLGQLGLNDREIVINYDLPAGCVTFPGARVELVENALSLPHVDRGHLKETHRDCLWSWADIYSDFPPPEIMNPIIRSIKLSSAFDSDIERAVGTRSVIGIHARFGDYSIAAGPGHPFVRGSNEYFLMALNLCLERFPLAQFYLASDGTPEELRFITSRYAVIPGRRENPLFDLFALSRCRMIIGSSSTFTAVAATYGNISAVVPGMSKEDIAAQILKI